MIPAVLAIAGILCFVAAGLLLRRLGPRYRIGRLLAAAPEASLVEAQALASSGERRYLRLHGRISSDEEFPDVQGGGLVVISREAEGRAADLPADLREGLDPDLPSRLVIEQVSAVEHAFVCGVPERRGDETWLVAGLGRPLVLTTLELGAAMRVLARDHRAQLRAVIALIPLGLALLLAGAIAVLLGVR